jgi:hypothetical protein
VAPHILNYNDTNVSLGSIYTYRISTTAGSYESSFSNDATAYVPTIVSVELVSFTAEFMNDKVKLNWTTGTETNNSGFEIERRAPSKSPPKRETFEEWEKIGFVSGFGTTTEPKSYSFTDDNVTTGKYKYRLKQVDYDGTFEYSNEVEIEVNLLPKEFILYQNYPNPFNPITVIKYEIPGQARNDNALVTLKVYDLLGREVATLINEEKPAGRYEVIFDASSLASGVYFYRLEAGSFSSAKKMLLIK